MKHILIGMSVLFLAAFVLFSGCTTQESTQTDDTQVQMEAVVKELTQSIENGLNDVKSGIHSNSIALSEFGLTGDAAEKTLSQNLLNYPWAQSSLVISKEGVVVTAVPKNYAEIRGEDLGWQSQVQTANSEQKPMVSDLFTMAEGFTGISQSYPIFSELGDYLGYTDITYRSETFLGRQILPIVEGTPYDVWVSQTDGTLIYDTKKEEIGNNLLSDPMYKDPVLQAVLTRIIQEPFGSDEYTFSDKNWNKNVTKKAVWETAEIDGVKWRVVVTYSDNRSEGETKSVPADGLDTIDARYENLTAFVESAALYAKENGKEASLKEFNDVNGEFIQGELYIFAYETDGTAISLPYQKELLGTNRLDIPDSNGVLFINAILVVASDGGGSLYYIYPNPKDDYKNAFKLSYVVPVDDEWCVGAGIYLPEFPAEFSDAEKDELVKRVKAARDYAQETGREQAVSDFNDLNQTFADGTDYIFAYDYEGNTLALPFQPEVIGINRLDFGDTYGVKIIRLEISAAKNGGGFVYVEYFNPDTGNTGFKLCYVEPVDDEWLVGSGMYTQNL